MKSILKTSICSMFAFLLTLLFLMLFVSLGLSFGVFNDRSVLSKLTESNYYSKVYDRVNADTEAIVQTAGFPKTVLDDVITLERVYIGGKNYINNVLKGKDATIQTEKLRAVLSEHINNYLNEQEIIRTKKLESGIESMISAVEDEYVNGIQLQFVKDYSEDKTLFTRLMLIVLPALIVLIGILCYFLIRMNHYKHRGLRYINYALIASSCLTLLIAAYLLITQQDRNIEVSPDYYFDFITMYLRWDIMVFIYLGEIGLVISMVLISLIGFMKSRINNG